MIQWRSESHFIFWEIFLRVVTSTQVEYLMIITSGGGGRGGYSHTLPIRVCAAQQGRDFEAPDLERAIHFRGVF